MKRDDFMKNVKEIKIEIKGKEWEAALDKAFDKKKKDIKVDGFRKGCCPKDIYLKKVGVETLFMDACDLVMDTAYQKALKEFKEDVVAEPNVSIEKIDKSGVTFVFTLVSRPEVTLGKYKKLGVKREKVTVSDDEIEHEISHLVEHMAEIEVKEKGKVEEGDIAIIDFDGIVDGKALEGGSAKGYSLEIGSHSFIPGFEEGVKGMKLGEEKELALKFPDDYQEDLKGKDVTFKVKVNEIKVRKMPTMDKDFFEDLAIEGVDSEAKLKEHVTKELTERKEHAAEDKYIDELLRKATDDLKVEINPEIIHEEIHRMIHQYEHELASQGITLDQYLSFTGGNREQLESMMEPQALARIKTRYLLEEVVKAEKIEVSQDEVKEEIKKICEEYDMKEKEMLAAIGGKENIEFDLKMRKAIEIIKES